MMKQKRNRIFITLGCICTLVFFVLLAGCSLFIPLETYDGSAHEFTNPYGSVDWNDAVHYDANFHTHTHLSDGDFDPHAVIDRYAEAGYSILALTDHDDHHFMVKSEALFPWTALNDYYQELLQSSTLWEARSDEPWQNRDPGALGMVAIAGSEISNTDHIGSLFNNYAGGTESEAVAFTEISTRDGLAVFHHPGRYDRTVDWYVDYLGNYDAIVGIEVFNQNDRYGGDRRLWDKVLHQMMPTRPVWGFANDDMHGIAHLGANRNVFPLPSLDETQVRSAMVDGAFYLFRPKYIGDLPSSRIQDISVTEGNIVVTIDGEYEKIEWITYEPIRGRSIAVAYGEECSLTKVPVGSTFVRAVITLPDGMMYTQPFGIREKE